MGQPAEERIEEERDAWKELAEALAEVAMGRHVGHIWALGRLETAKKRLEAMGIKPPKEPEFPDENDPDFWHDLGPKR